MKISELLEYYKITGERLEQIKEILDECDMVRFAPTTVSSEMKQNIYSKATEVINYLEREMSRKKLNIKN